ncbi:MAG: choloylglycine hydrolase [Candidatus Roseilinea sp.]|nr:MAG: choloylglycine hydrolase [Candidatus Roseilinea sp.]
MCTRVLLNKNKSFVISGRTMDWPTTTEPKLFVYPRSIKRSGAMFAGHVVVAENPAQWTSKYGSVVTSMYGLGTIDGLNERGLAVHCLNLSATDFGPRDPSKPGVNAALWAQFLLDRAANVKEALELQEAIQVTLVEARGRKATLHMALGDASGDSATIEYVEGRPLIHHGREYCVMTNAPPFDEQLALLAQQDFSNPSSAMALPGNVNAVDRFQRAAYWLAVLPDPQSERDAIAGTLAILRNTSVPFGAPYKGFGTYDTEYRAVSNCTAKRYFFELSNSPNVIWADLKKFDLQRGAPARVLDPDNINLAGDVSSKFKKLAKAPY